MLKIEFLKLSERNFCVYHIAQTLKYIALFLKKFLFVTDFDDLSEKGKIQQICDFINCDSIDANTYSSFFYDKRWFLESLCHYIHIYNRFLSTILEFGN